MLSFLLVAGCATTFPRNYPGNDFGKIYVSSPRIETRERLVNDRRDQERWLRDWLKKADDLELGVSGDVDLRSLSSTSIQAGLVVDPALRINAINTSRKADNAAQAADDERALRSARNAARDQVLTKLNKQELTPEQADAELKKLGLTLVAPSTGTAAEAAADAASVAARKVGSGTAASAPSDGARRTTINRAPLEEFHDRLAVREIIRSELNDARLDDLHDLSGNTLYRLTFDAAVQPNVDASAWAVVTMKIKLDDLISRMKEDGSLFGQTKELFLRDLRNPAEANFRAMLARFTSTCGPKDDVVLDTAPAGRERAFRRAVLCASERIDRETRRGLEQHLTRWHPKDGTPAGAPRASAGRIGIASTSTEAVPPKASSTETRVMDLLLDDDPKGRPDPALRRTVLHQWAEWLGEVMRAQIAYEYGTSALACMFDLRIGPDRYAGQNKRGSKEGFEDEDYIRTQPPGVFRLALVPREAGAKLPAQCGKQPGDDMEEQFRRKLEQNLSAHVYAATPKELVQTLSEVSSNRKSVETILNMSAIGGSAALAAGLNNLRTNDAFYQALRRQPILVGFTENGRVDCMCKSTIPGACPTELRFGWVLGPSFQLSDDGKESRYRHRLIQRTVAAEISLPAWLGKLDVSFSTEWVREDGTARPDVTPPAAQQGAFTIELPAQPRAALAAIDDRYIREPKVNTYQYLDVVEGQPAFVLITGQNVWRSTDVYLGAQSARMLSILPDNRGVVAEFDAVRAPHGADTRKATTGANATDNTVQLLLVTSEGRVEAGRVSIHKPPDQAAKPAGGSPKASGTVPRVVAGVEYKFQLSAPLAGPDTAVARIGSSNDKNLKLLLDKTTQIAEDGKSVVFVLAADATKLKTGDPVRVELLVSKPSGAVEPLEVIGSGIYYKTEDEARAKATATRGKKGEVLAVALQLPKKSTSAFATLASGKVNASAVLGLPGSAEVPLKAACDIKAEACKLEFRVLDASIQDALAKAKPDDISLVIRLLGDDVPTISPEKTAVK